MAVADVSDVVEVNVIFCVLSSSGRLRSSVCPAGGGGGPCQAPPPRHPRPLNPSSTPGASVVRCSCPRPLSHHVSSGQGQR